MIVLGLTGSMGMGKTTTADFFRAEGIGVFDADATVHALYEGAAAPLVEQAFPGTVHDGKVDRHLLAERVLGDSAVLRALEAIVHPLVAEAQQRFLQSAKDNGQPLVVLDIPLLLEKPSHLADKVVLVTAPEAVQKARLLARPGMTDAKMQAILARQMSDVEKREKADFIIDTSLGLAAAQAEVRAILVKLLPPTDLPKTEPPHA
jgi:dephospho-CoA kinase